MREFTRILRIGRSNLLAATAWKLNDRRWNIEENCTGDVGGYSIGLALPINFSTSRVRASTLCARVFPSWILHVPRPCANQRPLEISVHGEWTAQRSNRRDSSSCRFSMYRRVSSCIVVADHQWNHRAAIIGEQVGESSPYIGPLYRKEARSRFRPGCWNVEKAATAHAWHFASSRRGSSWRNNRESRRDREID